MDYKRRTKYQRPATSDNIVAIDGPAGSGKSTVAKQLARKLGFLYVDTGAMYRAMTLKAVKAGINLKDNAALAKLAKQVDIQLRVQGGALKVILDGEDVSREIREQALTEQVHFVAGIKAVRKEMVKLQRRMAQGVKGAVLEGRDIGTVVFPQAKFKFYLDAQPQERIVRRFKELRRASQRISWEEVAADINSRDESDMTREVAPLTRAKDADYIDTTDLSVEAVVNKIIEKCSI